MGTISLEGLEFFAYHGIYEEEQKIGNKYSIDVFITTDLSKAAEEDKLKLTIDYSEVYEIIRKVMQQKHRLLEHVAHQIIQNSKTQFVDIQSIKVSVSKYNPPIGGICERARIVMEEKFS
jgi:dihydroneopterin aldolase